MNGKSARRRKAARVERLAARASANSQFKSDLDRTLASWVSEMRRRAGVLRGTDNLRMPSALAVLTQARTELAALLARVPESAASEVRDAWVVLSREYVRIVSTQVIDRPKHTAKSVRRGK
jgi:hypothetical protein